jgi:hypothetical protein
LSNNAINGCFYLDSSVVFSELLSQNKPRIEKLKRDAQRHNIKCYVSPSIEAECDYKIKKTINFLDFVLKKVIVAHLEGIQIKPRDLTTSKVSNEDLHRIREAFMLVNAASRKFDLIEDPFQAVEEFLVEKLDDQLEKPKKGFLSDFVTSLTANILEEITKLTSAFETLIDLEAGYISKSSETPDQSIMNALINNGIHTADAVHISIIASHQKKHNTKAVFLTFDYSTILCKWKDAQTADSRLRDIDCCDPIYGISFLR